MQDLGKTPSFLCLRKPQALDVQLDDIVESGRPLDELLRQIAAEQNPLRRMMLELHAQDPRYGFDRHKGYATREHLAEHNPLDRLAPLARTGVKLLHVHGDADTVVPLEKNSGELARRYRAIGGHADLVVVPGRGHQVCDEFFKSTALAKFLLDGR